MAKRAPTTERGYGSKHQAERARWQRKLDHGANVCCGCKHSGCNHPIGQCPTIITKASKWDLGHTDDRTGYNGPECIPCNRSAGARARNGEPAVTRWDW